MAKFLDLEEQINKKIETLQLGQLKKGIHKAEILAQSRRYLPGGADISKLRGGVWEVGTQPTEEGSGGWLFQESLRTCNKATSANVGNTAK